MQLLNRINEIIMRHRFKQYLKRCAKISKIELKMMGVDPDTLYKEYKAIQPETDKDGGYVLRISKARANRLKRYFERQK